MSMGRGLGAILTPTTGRKKNALTAGSEGVTGKSERVWLIPLSEIFPNPDQPRRSFNTDELKELADSIKLHGVLQPILVAEKTDGGYTLVAGERRYRAAKLLSLPTIPAIVKVLENEEQLEVALIENIQRSELNPLEEAFAFQRLIEEFGLTQQDVAEKVGKSRPAIANTVRLLTLPEEAQNALVEKKISMGQARALLGMSNQAEQLEMLQSMLGEKITVRELEQKVRDKKGKGVRRDPNALYVEEELRGALGTKVSLSQKGESGTITIHFFSKDELAEIVRKIVD
ncbi:MAG: ParB/RepB/Spo0J family partition protein [Patescibacteria group bacterium]|jgi:ParB family chromosome partitioning protein